MAISGTMSLNNNNSSNSNDDNKDEHEHDMVMPGFRFHPTEEELVEFYLRRKVEGKRFNVELITFLDLYRYDPWELPALAAIGEKEWFFYVPRDKKYRNGDRPNRVTTSGYWKATGADRMIRTESSRSIGLKKTLVFYSGKAPKGIRTSWIMNEYRLPQHETERYQKVEISLCRVYKRAGVEDHPSLPRSLPSTRASSSSRGPQYEKKQPHLVTERFSSFGGQSQQIEKMSTAETDGSSSSEVTTALGLSKHNAYHPIMLPNSITINTSLGLPSAPMDEDGMMFLSQSKQLASSLVLPNCGNLLTGLSSSTSASSSNPSDDLHRLINYQQAPNVPHHQQYYVHHPQQVPSQFSGLTTFTSQQSQPIALNMLPSLLSTAFSDRLWDWNQGPEANKDFNNPFK
ncbi:hypothetical protein K2173_015474 [Erythroxylum novogranatense]|uniref:NAC domain-containing protein n=1 Tax=Erythroxylum novogranatense TaxID=1862640 RepID=A0AAV8SRR0_9ROSI|nr:hypothetical protein K2173_015474 [Erythroxylum novogranatense]